MRLDDKVTYSQELAGYLQNREHAHTARERELAERSIAILEHAVRQRPDTTDATWELITRGAERLARQEMTAWKSYVAEFEARWRAEMG